MRLPALPAAALACLALAIGCGGDKAGPSSSSSGTGADEALTSDAENSNPLRHAATRLNGRRERLSKYRGSVVLVVNTATNCGFTPQFDSLQSLYDEYRRNGLVVLGFPSNDFASQEPRSNKEIGKFCRANYGVKFPMFAKTEVTGDGAHPLFKDLGAPKWNFNKYLLDRNGTLVKRWGAGTDPDDQAIEGPISRLL